MKNSLIFGIVLLFGTNTFACDFCMIGQGINPYLTSNGKGFTYTVDSTKSDHIYNKLSTVESNGKKEAWLLQTVTGFVALNDEITLLLSLPYASKTNIDFDSTSNLNPGTLTNGIGDVTLSGRYTMFKSHSLESTFLGGLLIGVKLPTGSTNLKDNGGNPVDRHAMPGTGSLDEILGLTSSYASANGYQFTGDAVYNFSGKGKWNGQKHFYGNSLNISLKGFYRISNEERKDRSVFVFTGPTYQYSGKEKGTLTDTGYQDSLVQESTGGQIMFWNLGLYAVFSPSVIGSYGKAIYHNMNFNPSFDADPAEKDRISTSVTFLF